MLYLHYTRVPERRIHARANSLILLSVDHAGDWERCKIIYTICMYLYPTAHVAVATRQEERFSLCRMHQERIIRRKGRKKARIELAHASCCYTFHSLHLLVSRFLYFSSSCPFVSLVSFATLVRTCPPAAQVDEFLTDSVSFCLSFLTFHSLNVHSFTDPQGFPGNLLKRKYLISRSNDFSKYQTYQFFLFLFPIYLFDLCRFIILNLVDRNILSQIQILQCNKITRDKLKKKYNF